MSEKRSVWFGFVGSFSPKFYKEISRQSFGRSFGYLVLLALTMSIVLSAKYSFDAHAWIQKGAEWVNADLAEKLSEVLPEITIKDGELSSPVKQPLVYEYEFKEEQIAKGLEIGKFAFILDTTGVVTSLDGYPNGILMTKNKMVFKYQEAGRSKIEEMEFKDVKSFKMTPGKEEGVFINFNVNGKDSKVTEDIIEKWAGIIGKFLFPVIMVGIFIYYLVAKLLQVLLFSLLSLIINSANNTKLNYGNLLNIGVFAMTPAVVLAVLAKVFNVTVPMFGLIYIGLYSAFLIMGVMQFKTVSSSEEK